MIGSIFVILLEILNKAKVAEESIKQIETNLTLDGINAEKRS